MAADASFFAADLGASGGRTAVVHLENDRITLQETHRFENGPLDPGDTYCVRGGSAARCESIELFPY